MPYNRVWGRANHICRHVVWLEGTPSRVASDALHNHQLALGRQRSRRLRFSAWATLPLLAVAYYALIVSSIPPIPRLLALEIVMLIPMTLTVIWSFKARAVSEAAERTFWGALAGAIITLIACEILLVYWVVAINPAGPPVVSWPFHILHGVAAAFMLTAVGALTRFSVGSVATRARWILDGLAVMIIAAIVLLQFYVRPIMQPAGATTGEILLGVAYPVFGIVMVLGILGNIVGFKIDRWRWWDRLFAVSFMIYAVGIILWPTLYPTAVETSRTYERHILDLVQFSGHWLLMAAAVYRITEVDEWRLRPLPPIVVARRRWLSAVLQPRCRRSMRHSATGSWPSAQACASDAKRQSYFPRRPCQPSPIENMSEGT